MRFPQPQLALRDGLRHRIHVSHCPVERFHIARLDNHIAIRHSCNNSFDLSRSSETLSHCLDATMRQFFVLIAMFGAFIRYLRGYQFGL